MQNLLSQLSSASSLRLGKLALCAAALALGFAACGGNDLDPAFFTQKGCVQCHSVSAFGITSAAQIGPDLSEAVEDVPKRFGKSLEEFLNNPTGTMQMVLSSQIKLTDAEKQQAVKLMQAAYEKKKAGK
jgi:cytochrome c551/c552